MRDFLSEENYLQRMDEEVFPRLAKVRRDHFIQTDDGKMLHCVSYEHPTPRGSVVILHGYTESAEKYRELAAYFFDAGLTVLLYDHRGHGRSVREHKKGLAHVRRFDHYIADFEAFLRTVAAHSPAPHYLFAHSMGGGIAALYLEKGGRFFKKAILDAPMIEPVHGPISYRLCLFLCSLKVFTGQGKQVVKVLEKPEYKHEGLAPDDLRSPVRVEYYRRFKRENPAYRMGPATYKWIYEALRAKKRILKRGAPESIVTPVRMYAAEVDRLVLTEPQKEFIDRVPCGEYIRVKGAGHEIFGSVDAVAHPFFESVLDYFEL